MRTRPAITTSTSGCEESTILRFFKAPWIKLAWLYVYTWPTCNLPLFLYKMRWHGHTVIIRYLLTLVTTRGKRPIAACDTSQRLGGSLVHEAANKLGVYSSPSQQEAVGNRKSIYLIYISWSRLDKLIHPGIDTGFIFCLTGGFKQILFRSSSNLSLFLKHDFMGVPLCPTYVSAWLPKIPGEIHPTNFTKNHVRENRVTFGDAKKTLSILVESNYEFDESSNWSLIYMRKIHGSKSWKYIASPAKLVSTKKMMNQLTKPANLEVGAH